MHRQMGDMMKMMGGAGGKRGLGQALGNMFGLGGGGMGGMPQPSPEQIAALQKQMGGAGGMPGGALPPMPPGLGGPGKPAGLPGLPGLGGPKMPGLPGLGGFPFGGKKK
jgi:signal recognition particle subunit SRP54